MATPRSGRIFAALVLLASLSTAPLSAGFEIRDSRLFLNDVPFVVRGVVYSNIPIGQTWSDRNTGAACFYPRDLPLIAAMGANTIRTLALMPPRERSFRFVLGSTNLYWLAGFPLDRFHDPERPLATDDADGRALRDEILLEFRDYVESWKDEPRVIAFVFGEDVGADYNSKFAGSPDDFYSLLAEAGAFLRDAGAQTTLLTTTVSRLDQIGSPAFHTDDFSQPDLAFWSLNLPGAEPVETAPAAVSAVTAKPLLVSSFGIDAYDHVREGFDPRPQAGVAEQQARAIDALARREPRPILGGVYATYADEWWRGGDPDSQTAGGREDASFPDGFLNQAWQGLLRVSRGHEAGLDRLRPRDAYFALARLWGGTPPPEFSETRVAQLDPGGVVNMAGGLPLLSPGALALFSGEGLASAGRSVAGGDLPFHLGPVSVCVERAAMPLFFSDSEEVRGQTPWDISPGTVRASVYRAGMPSNAAEFEVADFSPGIFDVGVFRPGRPGPVDVANGVPPGSYLEIYGTGLGPGETVLASGQAPAQVNPTAETPQAFLDGLELPVFFSGMLAGMAGIYQANTHIPEDASPSVAALSLLQRGIPSNRHRLRITGEGDRPGFLITLGEPGPIVLQAGGPARTVPVLLNAVNGFCDLIRFELRGVPTGVRARIPVGVPGQTLTLTLQAEPEAPAGERTVFLTGRSVIPETVTRSLAVRVLPSQGPIDFRVISGGFLSTAPVASFEMAGSLVHRVHGGGVGRGFNFLTIDAESGVLGPVRAFDTWASDEDVVAMETYLKALPDGAVVLAAIADEGALKITGETRRVVRETLGSGLIDHLEFRYSWAIISRKGAAKPFAEGLSPNGLVVLEETLTFPMP